MHSAVRRCKASPRGFRRTLALAALSVLAAGCGGARDAADVLPEGRYRGTLHGIGGKIPFVVEVGAEGAELVDGHERIAFDRVERGPETATLHFDRNAILVLRPAGHAQLTGTWSRAGHPAHTQEIGVTLRNSARPRFTPATMRPDAPGLEARWRCRFSKTGSAVVAVLHATSNGHARGTLLTDARDAGHFEGIWDGRSLRLARFDGARAQHLTAERLSDGSLRGALHGADADARTWHETFTATPDAAALPSDGFGLARWDHEANLPSLPDLEGREQRVADSTVRGPATVVLVFRPGDRSCREALGLWSDWERRERGRGLSVLGLALVAEPERAGATDLLRADAARLDVGFPLLVARAADPAQPGTVLPPLDGFHAFPTTVFLDAQGHAVAVHSGFTGRAAPEDHARMVARYRTLLDGLLTD